MTEKNENNTLIRNYTSNFAIKEYIQGTLIPKAFPDIPVGKLNLGLTGIVSEYISQLDEDSDFEPAAISSDGFDTIIDQECNKGVNPDLLLALSDLVKEG